jgi:hypothetical protein
MSEDTITCGACRKENINVKIDWTLAYSRQCTCDCHYSTEVSLLHALAESLRCCRLFDVNNAGAPADAMTTDEMRARYTVLGFSAPFVVVTRNEDGKKGSLEFTHSPRFYFNWVEDK